MKLKITTPSNFGISLGGIDTVDWWYRIKLKGYLEKFPHAKDSVYLCARLSLKPDIPNYPNPVSLKRGKTTFKFQIPDQMKVKLRIYTRAGEFVKELFNYTEKKGIHERIWNLKNNASKVVSPGTYIYVFWADNYRIVKKIVITE